MQIIFFNGLGVTPHSWDPLIEKLNRIRSLDFCKFDWCRYFLESEAHEIPLAKKLDYSFAELREIVDRRCIFVGHSFGTLIATNHALKLFGNAAKFIFLCPATVSDYAALQRDERLKKN